MEEVASTLCQQEGLVVKKPLPLNKLLVEGDESDIRNMEEYHCIESVEKNSTGYQLEGADSKSSGYIEGRVNRKKPHGGSALLPQGPRGTFHVFEDGEALCGRAGSVEDGTFLATEAELRSGQVRQGLWKLTVCGRCKSIHLSQ